MTVNLTCNQVSALLSFYLNDKLNDQLKQFVQEHLDNCPACRAKLAALSDMVKSLKEVHEKLKVTQPAISREEISPQYSEFKSNLSAYVDNELSDEDNIKVKKYVISNPNARQDLESMMDLRRLLHASFDKTKQEMKVDFSKFVLRNIDIHEELYAPDSFAKVVAFFIIMLTLFTLSAVIIFWI